MARRAKIPKRSIKRLRESGVYWGSVGTAEINEEEGPQAGSPRETSHYRLQTRSQQSRTQIKKSRVTTETGKH